MTITLTPETEAKLIRFATSRGLAPEEALDEIVVAGIELKAEDARARNRAIALKQAEEDRALLEQWKTEEATDDPEELKRRDQDMLELQLALNANRKATGERVPFPELEPAA